MNRRGFFARLLGLLGVAVVAPKVKATLPKPKANGFGSSSVFPGFYCDTTCGHTITWDVCDGTTFTANWTPPNDFLRWKGPPDAP